jgi:rhodanese-related sulfurtransferase
MPTNIDRNTLQRMLADGAQLLEVLPPAEYAEDHLPGAVNVPLRGLRADAVATLRKDVPVITYCWDGI